MDEWERESYRRAAQAISRILDADPRRHANAAKAREFLLSRSQQEPPAMITTTATRTRKPTAKPTARVASTAPAIHRAADRFRMMGDATRLSLVLLLATGERNVTEMCTALGMSQPALSASLRLLRTAGIAESRRDGKHVVYSLTGLGREIEAAASGMTR